MKIIIVLIKMRSYLRQEIKYKPQSLMFCRTDNGSGEYSCSSGNPIALICSVRDLFSASNVYHIL